MEFLRDKFAQYIIMSVPPADVDKLKMSEFAANRCGEAISFRIGTWV